MSKRRLLFIMIGSLGVLIVLGGVFLVQKRYKYGNISGIVHHEPNSCINAGLGCIESYIEVADEQCGIDSAIAEKYRNKQVVISGIIERTNREYTMCNITVKKIRSL